MSESYFLKLALLLLALWVVPCLLFIGYNLRLNRSVWKISAPGMITPWVVGALVKFQLENLGLDTIPWSSFLTPYAMLILIPVTIWWGIPFIVLAYISRNSAQKKYFGIESERGKFYLFFCILTGSMLGACRVFVYFFGKLRLTK